MPLRIVGGVFLVLGLLGLAFDLGAPPRPGEFPDRPERWGLFALGAVLIWIGRPVRRKPPHL